MHGDLAVLARSGAPERRGEAAGVERAVRDLGLRVAHIEAPGTLDGGDVLRAGDTAYVGLGGRTNGVGIQQLGRTTCASSGFGCRPCPSSERCT